MPEVISTRRLGMRPITVAAALLCGLLSAPAVANERAELERLRGTTLNLIKLLVDGGLLSQEKAEQLLKQAQQDTAPADAAAAQPAAPASATAAAPRGGVIRVPYVPESLRNQMRDEIKQEVLNQARSERWGEPGALPAWARRINFEGDVRFRLQSEDWDRRNVSAAEGEGLAFQNDAAYEGPIAWSPDLTNTQDRRDRMTLRARFGLTSDLAFGFKTGLRLSTGNAQALSTSQTLGGSNGNFSNYSVLLDRAWIQWTPHQPDVTATVGRFSSPYFGGDLIWPDDMNFDGVAVKATHAFNDANKVFVNAGAFPLSEFQSDAADAWLYGAQVGAIFKPDASSQFDIGLGYYDFNNIEGNFDPMYRDTANTFSAADKSYLSSEYKKAVRQRGNTLIRINQPVAAAGSATAVAPVWGLASKFRPLTLSAAYNHQGFEGLSMRISADFIHNTGFSQADIRRRAQPGANIDLAKKTNAWQARAQIGSTKQELLGDWSAYLGWRRFERDAWVDAFTDTTWHLGGTNYVGWTLGGAYYVGPRTSLGLRLTSTRNLTDGRTETLSDGAEVPNLSSIRQRVDVLQVELNSRF
ncbi:putative porin [Aquabacterium parvum]|uniref:putative porin n=1 Tax=Aquabacterium parvum TaxID=70584 RepID=UPI00128EE5A3|nr:putative porin [Aquabacterium parvum]